MNNLYIYILYMKLSNPFKNFTAQEFFALGALIVYLVFPIHFPQQLNGYIASPIGILVLFAITIGMFLYVNSILAVLFVFVVYEVLRRSNVMQTYKPSDYVQDNTVQEYNYVSDAVSHESVNVPSVIQEHMEPQQFSMPEAKSNNIILNVGSTLEEDMIKNMSPLNSSNGTGNSFGDFKPKSDKIDNASPYI